jgi:hypothetical protein
MVSEMATKGATDKLIKFLVAEGGGLSAVNMLARVAVAFPTLTVSDLIPALYRAEAILLAENEREAPAPGV